MLGTGFEKLELRKYPLMDLVTSLLYSRLMDVVWTRFGRTNPYTRSLEARVKAFNKEPVCGLVRPKPLDPSLNVGFSN
jgi:hypothetical protein